MGKRTVFVMALTAMIFLAPSAVYVAAQCPEPWRAVHTETLRTLRARYVNQTVIIGSTLPRRVLYKPDGSIQKGMALSEWDIATVKNGRYEGAFLQSLPETFLGSAATVIELQYVPMSVNAAKKNALGEEVSEDDTPDPLFNMIVKFDDGTIAMASSAYTIEHIAAIRNEAIRVAMSQRLPQLIGKPLYATACTDLYAKDSSVEDLISGIASRLEGVAFLRDLEVVNAKYIDWGVVIKVRLPSGIEALSFVKSGDIGKGPDSVLGNASTEGTSQAFCPRGRSRPDGAYLCWNEQVGGLLHAWQSSIREFI